MVFITSDDGNVIGIYLDTMTEIKMDRGQNPLFSGLVHKYFSEEPNYKETSNVLLTPKAGDKSERLVYIVAKALILSNYRTLPLGKGYIPYTSRDNIFNVAEYVNRFRTVPHIGSVFLYTPRVYEYITRSDSFKRKMGDEYIIGNDMDIAYDLDSNTFVEIKDLEDYFSSGGRNQKREGPAMEFYVMEELDEPLPL